MNIFFYLSKFLTVFLFPLPLCIMLGIFLVLFKIKGAKNKFLAFLPIGLIWLAASFPICESLVSSLEKDYPPKSISQIEKADAIVVLGGMINTITQFPERIELTSSADRLTDSILLFKEKKGDYLIFTGGSGLVFEQESKESTFAKKFFVSFGIPEDKIILESESRNTFENGLYTKRILEEKKWKRIILVTSAFHMKRSVAIFEKLGIEVIPFPTDYRSLKATINWETLIPSTGAIDTTTLAIKEWIGIFVYQMKGYL